MTNSNPLQPAAKVFEDEAKQLRSIWDANPEGRPGQAQFGELFEIGGQSAVANFLNGRSPLSLKAALGFARGLKVRLQDFSPRLATEAISIAKALDELHEYSPASTPPWRSLIGNLDNALMLGEIKGDENGCCETELKFDTNLVVDFWTSHDDAIALRIRGDAFYPRYRSGEFLVLSEKAPPLEGYEALVTTWDVKKYLRIWNGTVDGEVTLLPLAPGSAPITLRSDDIERVERVLGCAPRDALRKGSQINTNSVDQIKHHQ